MAKLDDKILGETQLLGDPGSGPPLLSCDPGQRRSCKRVGLQLGVWLAHPDNGFRGHAVKFAHLADLCRLFIGIFILVDAYGIESIQTRFRYCVSLMCLIAARQFSVAFLKIFLFTL